MSEIKPDTKKGSKTVVTEEFKLLYGLEYEGQRHFDGVLRLANLEDQEYAIEEAPEGACAPRVQRYAWSRCIERLGDIPKDAITPELLAGLVASEWGIINAAEERLKKKSLPGATGPTA